MKYELIKESHVIDTLLESSTCTYLLQQ